MVDAKSILLIEDHDTVRRYYADHLRLVYPQYVVMEAVTGQMGLKLYQRQTIDCVVLDLSLPDMSGFEVLAKLVPMASQPLVPVLILSCVDSEELFEEAKIKGAFLGLRKAQTSAEELAKVVVKAMAAIPRRLSFSS